ncbi:MAG: hypothetical protein JOZ98_16290 [Solirubrobacterales bacterium]|nr:hypothetical protein [Solirubrobacterales bacterium]
MSDERVHLDGESEWWLAELWSTPVGRRWLLKAGLGSAAATVATRGWGASAQARQPVRGAASAVRLQCALGAAKDLSDLVLVADGVRYPLVAHTTASRAALRAEGGLWGKVRLSALTHHVAGVRLPTHRGIVVSVYARRGGREVLVSQLWHCPADATLALAKVAHRLKGSLKSVAGSGQRLASLGVSPAQLSAPREAVQLGSIMDTYTTAEALVAFHPNVATVDKTALAATKSVLGQTPAVQTLGEYIQSMQRRGRDYATTVTVKDKDGSDSQIKLGDKMYTFSTIELNRDDPKFAEAHRSALLSGIRGIRDSAQLGAVIDKPLEQDKAASTKTWVQPQGVVPQPTPYSRQLAATAGLDIKVKNDGFLFGTRTQVTGSYQNGKVPLKLYNNFVRWLWVYVQYLGKDDENLSANPNATFPDTKHAKSLGMLPQVFTVLGVPVWDTNSIDVTLDFPQGAHTARLLYCGLGSDLFSGGWRQYFPADAYAKNIAPTDEVLFPSLMTGILTIGLNLFALVTDLDIAATWIAIRGYVAKNLPKGFIAFNDIVLAIGKGALPLTASESVAALTAAGGATYEDIASNGGSKANIWSILLALGSVIPKILFNPGLVREVAYEFVATLGTTIIGEVTAVRIVNALPFIGEAIAVISLVGDAVTLAEVCAESVICPWVIENEVSLTYGATVTIARDSRDATFPKTARSWRLEAKVDGALVLAPITGSVNGGGTLRSDPLVVEVVAPFGGKQIQWSVVFSDSAGNQVGTGVSALFANDDPNNLPSKVGFAITELPPTLTSKTVFKRVATTAYDRAAGGYTWSDRVAVPGTVATARHQEVISAAIATRLGVAGAVFKQADRYYVRGVPTAQNGKTIKLGAAPQEGYARRPFLLFDSFVEKADEGNHALLEPDSETAGYHVRKLTLDPGSGRLEWDPTVSYGQFLLPVSAAALHSSGRVVTVHTDSGRVGSLQPVAIPAAAGGPQTPQLAAYTAGPGTQIGLLSSPVALAVTNPGTVLILEAAGLQLSAFDLNGNPVPYFGKDPDRKYTLALTAGRTYLDLAVDGTNQIYLLSHAGDGSHPEDYYLDVYTETGDPLVTNSSGVNVPHIAVDYWRSIYAANYDPLTDLGTTKPHIDPTLGVTEPSLSRFDPTLPTTRLRPPRFTG